MADDGVRKVSEIKGLGDSKTTSVFFFFCFFFFLPFVPLVLLLPLSCPSLTFGYPRTPSLTSPLTPHHSLCFQLSSGLRLEPPRSLLPPRPSKPVCRPFPPRLAHLPPLAVPRSMRPPLPSLRPLLMEPLKSVRPIRTFF